MKRHVVVWHVTVLGLVCSAVTTLVAARTTTFSAWTWGNPGWSDSVISLQYASLDPRNDRQISGADVASRNAAVAFATQYKGHLYVVGDEPDLGCNPPQNYAIQFHDFVATVRAIDSTSTFSPAGFAPFGSRAPLAPAVPFPFAVDYAAAFYYYFVRSITRFPARIGNPCDGWRFSPRSACSAHKTRDAQNLE